MTQPAEGVVESPLRVAVFGSCMSRDNFNSRFNPGYKAWFQVVATQVQASVISLMSRPTPVPEDALSRVRPYEASRLRVDFSKRFLAELAELEPDYLVVDFSGDIRFGAIRLEDDRWVTGYRRILKEIGWPPARLAAGSPAVLRVERAREAYLAPWSAAVDRFAGHVRRTTPRTKVVLHRGHHTRLLHLPEAGGLVPLAAHRRVPAQDPDRIDALWSRMDDHVVRAHGWEAIDLRGGHYPTSDAHPWGAGGLHYAPDYYRDFLAALCAIHLRRTHEPDGPRQQAMAELVAGRREEATVGRSWDREPGRGFRAPKAARPRRGPMRRAAGLARRRLTMIMGPRTGPSSDRAA